MCQQPAVSGTRGDRARRFAFAVTLSAPVDRLGEGEAFPGRHDLQPLPAKDVLGESTRPAFALATGERCKQSALGCPKNEVASLIPTRPVNGHATRASGGAPRGDVFRVSNENPLVATSAAGRTRQLESSRGLSLTGRVIATIGGALLVSAVWTPWFFGLVGTAVVLTGVALLEYRGPYDDNQPTFSPHTDHDSGGLNYSPPRQHLSASAETYPHKAR